MKREALVLACALFASSAAADDEVSTLPPPPPVPPPLIVAPEPAEYEPPAPAPKPERSRLAGKVFGGWAPNRVAGIAFPGFAIDGAVGVTLRTRGSFVDFFGGLGYERGVADSGLELSKGMARAHAQFRIPYFAIGGGFRMGTFAVTSDVGRASEAFVGFEATANIEPLPIDLHAFFVEGRAFVDYASSHGRGGFSLGVGFRY